jgi:predicted nucleotidyltransferase
MTKNKGILFVTNTQKVLDFFLNKPGEEFLGRELEEKVGISRSGIYYALKELTNKGFLCQCVKSRINFYSLNYNNPVVKHLKVLKTVIEIQPLLEKLKKLSSRIVLFGSSSRGETVKDSDIDLFIITHNKAAIEKEITKFGSKQRIQAVKKTELEYVELKRNDPVFYEQINRGILLWEVGDES